MEITFVTAYYDLCKYEKRPPDRTRENYYKWSEFILNLNKKIIFFVGEEQDFEYILDKRKQKNYLDKTIIIIKKFEEIPLVSINKELSEYLKESPPVNKTDKETSYFALMTWSKIFFMEEVIKLNPYKTEYFGWIDFGIHHVTCNNIPNDINNLLIPLTPKIRILERIWTTELEMKDIVDYAKKLRCKMAGGLWIAKEEYMILFIKYFKKYLYKLLSKRLVVQEEGIFGIIYHKHKDIFDTFLGNYYNIFENYKKIEKYDFIMLFNLEYCRDHDSFEHGFNLCNILLNHYNLLSDWAKYKIMNELSILGFYYNKKLTGDLFFKWIEYIKTDSDPNVKKIIKDNSSNILYNIKFYDWYNDFIIEFNKIIN